MSMYATLWVRPDTVKNHLKKLQSGITHSGQNVLNCVLKSLAIKYTLFVTKRIPIYN